MDNGAERIARERRRQLEKLGYTAKYDNSHRGGELAIAAACYAAAAGGLRIYTENRRANTVAFSDPWPWPRDVMSDARPHSGNVVSVPRRISERIRLLEKAGALIAAEIDRLLRRGGQ